MRAFHINVTFGAVNSCAGGACGAGTKNAFGFGDESREARDRSAFGAGDESAFGTGDRGRLRRGFWPTDSSDCHGEELFSCSVSFCAICVQQSSSAFFVTRDRSPASPLHHSPSFVICAGSLLAALPPAPRPYTEPFGQ